MYFGTITFPTGLADSIVDGIEGAFSSGLGFVAPILVAVVGINMVRTIINRGKSGKV